MPIVLVTSNYAIARLFITGSTAILDRSSTQYTANVEYVNGVTRSISASWVLTSNTIGATITSDGLLTIPDIVSDATLTITASYTDSSGTYTNSLTVSITNSALLASISISGPTAIDATADTQALYTAISTYNDGSTLTVTPTWTITGNSHNCTITSTGLLTALARTSIDTVVLQADYTENGISKTASLTITVGIRPITLTIDGLLAVADKSTSQYAAIVNYSDGSTKSVAPTWTLGGTDDGTTISELGVLTVPDLKAGTVRSLTASFTDNGKTVTGAITLAISNTYDIKAIEIIGPSTIDDNSNNSYSLRFTFTDNTTYAVPDAQITWALNGNTVGATFANATLTVPNLDNDITMSLTATTTYLNDTKTSTIPIIVRNTFRVQRLEIVGSSSISDNSNTSYTCNAVYSDGSSVAVSPTWSLSRNEVSASLIGSTVHVPVIDYNGNFELNASYMSTDGLVTGSLLISAVKAVSITQLRILGWAGTDTALFNGVNSYLFNATEGLNILPGTAFDSESYISCWVDFDTSLMIHVGGGTNAKTIFAGVTASSEGKVRIRTNFWSQNKAYRSHALLVNKPSGLAHLVVNYGDKKVWINGSYVGQMAAEYTAMDGIAELDTGLWIGATPAPTSLSHPIRYYVSRITNLVFGSINLTDSQVSSLYAYGSDGNYFDAPSRTAWYKLKSDSYDHFNTRHLSGKVNYENSNTIYDNKSTELTCLAVYDDSSAKLVTAAWELESNAHGVTLAGSTLTCPEIAGEGDSVVGTVHLTATYTEGSTFTKDVTVSIINNSWIRSLKIIGTASVNEDSTNVYTCRGYFEDNSSQIVSPEWSLSVNDIGATIANGTLVVPVTNGRKAITIAASYTTGGVTQTTTKSIVVSNGYKLDSIVLDGPDSVNEVTATQFTCTALYNDLGTALVEADWSLALASVHGLSAAGTLTTIDMTGTANDNVTIQASYTENGVTKTASKVVTVVNSVYLNSLTILGPSINYGSTETYTCIATLSNNQVVTVSPAWSVIGTSFCQTTIDNTGTFTASDITDGSNVTINVSAVYNGVLVNSSKTVYVDTKPKTFDSLDIGQSISVDEYTLSTLTATAKYSDNSTATVNATWSVTGQLPDGATLVGNQLTVYNVSSDIEIPIKASYTENGVTLEATATLLIRNTLYPTALTITGTTNISDKSVSQYLATVTYSDSTTEDVTSSCTWTLSSNDIGATIGVAGLVTVPNIVIDNDIVTINASYTDSGYTVTDTFDVTVSNQIAVSYLNVVGPDTIDDHAGTSFACQAIYPDNSAETITPTWSLSNNSIEATIDVNGIVTIPDIDSDSELTVIASYLDGSTLVTASKDVTVRDSYFDISSIEIYTTDAGAYRDFAFDAAADFSSVERAIYLEDNRKYTLTCTIKTPKGGTRTVNPAWSLSITDSRITIDANGVLSIDDLSGSLNTYVGSFDVIATLTVNGVVRTQTTSYIVKNTFYLKSAAINCDVVMNDITNQQLTCISTYARYGTLEVMQGDATSVVWSIVSSTLVPVPGSFGATIDPDGLLHIGNIGGISGIVVVNARNTEGGITYNAQRSIKVNNTSYPTSIVINGPDTVDDHSIQNYTFTVYYNNGSSEDIDPSLITVSGTGLSVSVQYLGAGAFRIADAPYDYANGFRINAAYTEANIRVNTTRTIAVRDTYHIDHFVILGPTTVSDMTTTSYTLKAVYTDGTETAWNSGNYASTWAMNPKPPGCSISSGSMRLVNVIGPQTITLSYTPTIYGRTITGSLDIAINDVYKPTRLRISGPAAINDKYQAGYRAYAVYTNGTQVDVTGICNWSLADEIEASITLTHQTGNTGYITLVTGDVDSQITTRLIASCTFETIDLYVEYPLTIRNYWGVISLYVQPDYPQNGVWTSAYGYYFWENRTYSFYARARYTDGSQAIVPPNWTLLGYQPMLDDGQITLSTYESRAYLTVNDLNSYYTQSSVPSVRANYTEKGKSVVGSYAVRISNTYRINKLVVNAPAEVTDMSRTQITCIVSHTDGGPDVEVIPTRLSIISSSGPTGARIEGSELVIPNMKTGTKGRLRIAAYYTEKGISLSAASAYIQVTEAYGLASLTISGPTIVNDQSTAQYTCVASYPDGTSRAVRPVWYMGTNPANAIIDTYGRLSVPDAADCTIEVAASYLEDGRTVYGSMNVSVRNTYYVNGLTINGTSSTIDRTTVAFSCTASYNTGDLKTINPTWSVSGVPALSISSSGVLTVPDTIDGIATVTASYTEGGLTVTNTKQVTVVNAYKVVSIEITGPTQANDKSTAQYLCTATYSDGTAKAVIPTWSVSESGYTIANGFLTIPNIAADAQINVNASYTEGGITVYASLLVAVANNYRPILYTLTGLDTITDKSNNAYRAFITYTDGAVNEVTGSTSWSLTNNTVGAYFTSNSLTMPDVSAPGSVTVNASCTLEGITFTTLKNVNVSNTFILTDILIVGTASFDASNSLSKSYSATAVYSDTSTAAITPSWSIVGASYGCSVNSSGVLTVPAQNSAGSITLQATYTDAGVTVAKQKTINWTVILPVSLAINGSTTVDATNSATTTYSAVVTLSDTTTKSVTPTWSIVGDALNCAIAANGSLTIASQAIAGSIVLRADYVEKGVTVSKQLTVALTVIHPTSLAINGSTTVDATNNTTTTYTATATLSDNSTATVVPTWSINGASLGCTIDSSGVLTIPSQATAGSIVVQADYTDHGVSVTKQATINFTVILPTSLAINGSTTVDATSSTSLTFTATATYSNNSTATVVPTWSIVGNSLNSILDSTGLLTIPGQPAAGSLTIQASYTEHGVTVTKQATITLTVILPTSISITGVTTIEATSATSKTYTATVTYSDNHTSTVTPTWSIVGTSYGCSIDNAGMLIIPSQATSVNTIKVQADYTENGTTVTAQLLITLTASALSVISVPASAILYISGDIPVNFVDRIAITGSTSVLATDSTTTTYTATATYSDQSTTPVTPTWSIVGTSYGCSISTNGVLTVPAQAQVSATLTLQADYSENGVTVSTQYVITLTAVLPSSLAISGSSTLDVTYSTNSVYAATVTYSDNSTLTVTPTWSLVGNSSGCSINAGLLVAPAQTGGTITIAAQYTEHGVTVNAEFNVMLTSSMVTASDLLTVLLITGDNLPN